MPTAECSAVGLAAASLRQVCKSSTLFRDCNARTLKNVLPVMFNLFQ